MYVLVRHGHTRGRKGWPGSDQERPLSERGIQQAAGIAETLHTLLDPRLVASPYLRCRQTLAPLAAKVGGAVIISNLLAPDADVSQLDLLLAGPDGEGTVFCTHGETLDALFSLWLERGVLDLADGVTALPRTEKGAAWVVIPEEGRRTAHYQRPLHIGPLLDPSA